MTAFDPSVSSPPAIATLEQAAAHALLALESLYGGTKYKEADGTAIDAGLALLIDTSYISAADGTKRLIARVSLPLDPAYVTDKTKKMWLHVQPLGNTQLPVAFTQD